jgi:hypothetical protein
MPIPKSWSEAASRYAIPGGLLRVPDTAQSAPAAHHRPALRSVARTGSHSASCRLLPCPLAGRRRRAEALRVQRASSAMIARAAMSALCGSRIGCGRSPMVGSFVTARVGWCSSDQPWFSGQRGVPMTRREAGEVPETASSSPCWRGPLDLQSSGRGRRFGARTATSASADEDSDSTGSLSCGRAKMAEKKWSRRESNPRPLECHPLSDRRRAPTTDHNCREDRGS